MATPARSENTICQPPQEYTLDTLSSAGDPMKLLIRNLARTTTEEGLKELFEGYGRVQSCVLVVDIKSGVSKGFGFIEMPKVGEANAAMKNLNGQDVDGKKIRVKKAETSPDKDSTPVSTTDK